MHPYNRPSADYRLPGRGPWRSAVTETDIEAIRAEFEPAPGTAYLDTASYGLPPRATVAALGEASRAWQAGTAWWLDDWDLRGEECRAAFARLIGAGEDEIALVPTVSVAVAAVAASLGPGDEVLVPEEEFTSVLFPFLVAAERGGSRVRRAPFSALADAVRPGTTLVATSLVRSQDGALAPLDALLEATGAHGARVLIDATHGVPFVPLASRLDRIDYLVCHGYKHLLCPRGVGFFRVRRDRLGDVPPIHANWRSAAPPYARSYGGGLDLPESAARFDVSLDWLAWVGARPALDLLVGWQEAGAWQAPLGLAADLAQRLGLPRPGASIVSVPVTDGDAAQRALAAAGVRVSAPNGRLRLSTHVYTTPEHIARAAETILPFVDRGGGA